jgi:acyl-coenzyme A synthetase/AMP-(fatty) acid ligase
MWGIDIGNLYGATELGTVAIHVPAPGGGAPSSPGFVGRPIGPAHFIIVDPADCTKQLPAGHEGHLAVRAPSMLSCYLGEAMPVTDGHFLTGDLARLDEAGALTITGRIKHLIDLGSCKVNPLEIEAAILSHPGVAECAVIPIAASSTLCRLHALIVARPGTDSPTPEALRQFLRPRLAAAKIPRAFRLVQSLPKSPTGKLLRDQC